MGVAVTVVRFKRRPGKINFVAYFLSRTAQQGEDFTEAIEAYSVIEITAGPILAKQQRRDNKLAPVSSRISRGFCSTGDDILFTS